MNEGDRANLLVVAVLRRCGWGWFRADEIWGLLRDQGVRRRTVRLILHRLADEGVVDYDDVFESWRAYRFHWCSSPDPEALARIEATAAEIGFDLPPVGQPPTHCNEGHELTGLNMREHYDGHRVCARCMGWRVPVSGLR